MANEEIIITANNKEVYSKPPAHKYKRTSSFCPPAKKFKQLLLPAFLHNVSRKSSTGKTFRCNTMNKINDSSMQCTARKGIGSCCAPVLKLFRARAHPPYVGGTSTLESVSDTNLNVVSIYYYSVRARAPAFRPRAERGCGVVTQVGNAWLRMHARALTSLILLCLQFAEFRLCWKSGSRPSGVPDGKCAPKPIMEIALRKDIFNSSEWKLTPALSMICPRCRERNEKSFQLLTSLG